MLKAAKFEFASMLLGLGPLIVPVFAKEYLTAPRFLSSVQLCLFKYVSTVTYALVDRYY